MPIFICSFLMFYDALTLMHASIASSRGISFFFMFISNLELKSYDDGIDVGDVDLAVAVDALAIFKPTVTCHDVIVVSSFFVVLMLYFRLDDFDMILTI